MALVNGTDTTNIAKCNGVAIGNVAKMSRAVFGPPPALVETTFIPATEDWVRRAGAAAVSANNIWRQYFSSSSWNNQGGFLPLGEVAYDFDFKFRFYDWSGNNARAAMSGMASNDFVNSYAVGYPHAFYFTASTCYIRENNVNITSFSLSSPKSSYLRIRRVGSVVDYLKDDVVIYTSTNPYTGALAPQCFTKVVCGVYNCEITYYK